MRSKLLLHVEERTSRILFSWLAVLAFVLVPVNAFGAEAEIPGGKEFLEGRRLQRAGEWADSIERFRAAADIYSLVADHALYQTAQSALQVADMDMSASALEKLLSLHPKSSVAPRARMELVTLYFNTDQRAKAIPHLEAALRTVRSSGESASLTLMLAQAYAAADKASMSESILWRIIHTWPSSPEALEATQLASEADTPQKQLSVAKVYSLNKKGRKALNLLQELMMDPRVGPIMPEILFFMAESFKQEGNKQAAADLFSEIIADYPDSSQAPTAYFRRARHRRSNGMTSEALHDYAQIVDRFPRSSLSPQALYASAKIYETLNSPEEYGEYQRLLEKYPGASLTIKSTMYWGVKLYQAGDYTGAQRVFEKLEAADINRDANADAAFWIAKCTIAQGKTSLAKMQLVGVIKRFEESHQGFRARSILESLADVQTLYSQDETDTWGEFFAFEKRHFASLESEKVEQAFPSLRQELSHLDRQTLDRLGFFMLNHLPEAKGELEQLSRNVSGPKARYTLAWAMFHAQGYNDSIRIASSLRGRFKDEPKASRLMYLLYPVAYSDRVQVAASRYDIDPMLTLAVMREESHFGEESVSSADARGLMQIIPRTGEWLAGKVFGPASFDQTLLFRPAVNIQLGSYYLRYLLDRFDDNVLFAVAAYNWGEGNLRRWLADSPSGDLDVFIENIPADETRRYVKKVLRSYAVYHSLYPGDYLGAAGEEQED